MLFYFSNFKVTTTGNNKVNMRGNPRKFLRIVGKIICHHYFDIYHLSLYK